MKKILVLVFAWFSINLAIAGTMPVVPVAPQATEFTVTLPGNATTGYKWDVTQFNKKWLALKGQSYQSKKSQMVGQGGAAVFNFSILTKKHPKEIPIWFVYHRPWEKKFVKPLKVLVIFTEVR